MVLLRYMKHEYNIASMTFAGHIHGAACIVSTLLN
jgi:hypothetical protein